MSEIVKDYVIPIVGILVVGGSAGGAALWKWNKNRLTDKKIFVFFRKAFNRTFFMQKFDTRKVKPEFESQIHMAIRDALNVLNKGYFPPADEKGPGSRYDIRNEEWKKNMEDIDKLLREIELLINIDKAEQINNSRIDIKIEEILGIINKIFSSLHIEKITRRNLAVDGDANIEHQPK